jgi:hypothetical protein
MFLGADHEFIRREARDLDARKLEKLRRQELDDHDRNEVAAKRTKDTTRRERQQKEQDRLASIGLILDAEEITKLTVQQLDDQIQLHRVRNRELPAKSRLKRKADKCKALLDTIDQYIKAGSQMQGEVDSEPAQHETREELDSDFELNSYSPFDSVEEHAQPDEL